MTVPAALRELEKIEIVRGLDGVSRMDHAVTATQESILKAFQMDADNIKKMADNLSKQLFGYEENGRQDMAMAGAKRKTSIKEEIVRQEAIVS